jgi:hypothetical protein
LVLSFRDSPDFLQVDNLKAFQSNYLAKSCICADDPVHFTCGFYSCKLQAIPRSESIISLHVAWKLSPSDSLLSTAVGSSFIKSMRNVMLESSRLVSFVLVSSDTVVYVLLLLPQPYPTHALLVFRHAQHVLHIIAHVLDMRNQEYLPELLGERI